jgi:hypothetical protein
MSSLSNKVRVGMIGVIGATLIIGCGSHGAVGTPSGRFNCEMAATALPDDRWSSCATPNSADCDLGSTAVPDDRWANCGTR